MHPAEEDRAGRMGGAGTAGGREEDMNAAIPFIAGAVALGLVGLARSKNEKLRSLGGFLFFVAGVGLVLIVLVAVLDR